MPTLDFPDLMSSWSKILNHALSTETFHRDIFKYFTCISKQQMWLVSLYNLVNISIAMSKTQKWKLKHLLDFSYSTKPHIFYSLNLKHLLAFSEKTLDRVGNGRRPSERFGAIQGPAKCCCWPVFREHQVFDLSKGTALIWSFSEIWWG